VDSPSLQQLSEALARHATERYERELEEAANGGFGGSELEEASLHTAPASAAVAVEVILHARHEYIKYLHAPAVIEVLSGILATAIYTEEAGTAPFAMVSAAEVFSRPLCVASAPAVLDLFQGCAQPNRKSHRAHEQQSLPDPSMIAAGLASSGSVFAAAACGNRLSTPCAEARNEAAVEVGDAGAICSDNWPQGTAALQPREAAALPASSDIEHATHRVALLVLWETLSCEFQSEGEAAMHRSAADALVDGGFDAAQQPMELEMEKLPSANQVPVPACCCVCPAVVIAAVCVGALLLSAWPHCC